MARIYVAAKFEAAGEARAVMNVLAEHGHSITHDWTGENTEGLSGIDVMGVFQQAADDDLLGVINAEAMVLLHHPAARGSLVEFGAALASNIPVIVVGGRPSASDLFYWHQDVLHAANVDEALAMLKDLFPAGAGAVAVTEGEEPEEPEECDCMGCQDVARQRERLVTCRDMTLAECLAYGVSGCGTCPAAKNRMVA